ncbi:MAG: pyridoxamine 5'-phosphate oxidase family protein [Acidobacteria bacterium]|nr:pyridoxamine 5'-phosphate oxidase family protein [Acidobacteriota bacterium]
MSKYIEPTDRTKLRRIPKRGSFERETVYEILDEGFVCHVGFVANGQPFVIPTAYGRAGDTLYIHGSAASRMMRELSRGVDVCVTVTLVDGLVLARSAFHHSINYRSVVVFGRAEIVAGEAEKNEALRVFTEHLIPHRWAEIREPDSKELKATTVLKLKIDEASAKIRTGNPVDDEDDYARDVWAGVLPLALVPAAPVADDRLPENVAVPSYLLNYER